MEYLIRAYKQIPSELPLIIAGDAPFVSDFVGEVKREAKVMIEFGLSDL